MSERRKIWHAGRWIVQRTAAPAPPEVIPESEMSSAYRSLFSPRLLRVLAAVASVVVFGLALWVIHRELQDYDLHDVTDAMADISWGDAVIAFLLSAASYVALTGFDSLGLRHVGADVRYRQVALASFVAQAISHSTGFAALTGSSIRYRFYSAAGVGAADVAKVMAFCALTFGLGAALVVGAAAMFEPERVAKALSLPNALIQAVGIVIFFFLAIYALLSATGKGRVTLGKWTIAVPSWNITAAQMLLAAGDLALAAAALYVLLPDDVGPNYPAFLGLYAAAIAAGVVSHVPGGLGIFEGIMVLFLPEVPASEVLSAVLVYRIVYNLIPLIIAAVMLGMFEVVQHGTAVGKTVRRMGLVTRVLTPGVFAALALLGGGILLASGATPAVPERIEKLQALVPLPVIEFSHLSGSIAGLWLLFLGRGLFRRIDAAYWLTLALFCTGVVMSLLKGWDYEEAIILGLFALVLAPSRKAFYRKASLLNQRFTPGWAATVAVFLTGTTWLAVFAFKDDPYSRQMWWQFAFDEDAPRTLRASIVVLSLGSAFLISRLLAPAPAKPDLPGPDDLAQAWAIAAKSPMADAQVVALGDKHLLFNAERDAFLMYGISGRSWVALGDPVGPESRWADLVWSFRELCDRHAGWPVFYQASADALPACLELGLSILKLGEEARVPLADFNLEGKARSELRYVHRRAQKDGATFEIIPPDRVAGELAELERVSSDWLTAKKAREKRFSLGYFSTDYLLNFPIAVVRQNGRIVAFANLWLSGQKHEMAIDLMRHASDSGYGVMDYLFIELMLWGKAQGYAWFSFGLAPLSGFRNSPLSPFWNRVGNFVFRHGEDWYNFQGLRRYKEKFAPIWQPRFLATPGGLVMPQVVADIATLISGGVKGLVMK